MIEIITLLKSFVILAILSYLFISPIVHFFSSQSARRYFFILASIFAIPSCITAIAGVDTLMVEKATSNIIFVFMFLIVAPISTILSLTFNYAARKRNTDADFRTVKIAVLTSLTVAFFCLLAIAASNGKFK